MLAQKVDFVTSELVGKPFPSVTSLYAKLSYLAIIKTDISETDRYESGINLYI